MDDGGRVERGEADDYGGGTNSDSLRRPNLMNSNNCWMLHVDSRKIRGVRATKTHLTTTM